MSYEYKTLKIAVEGFFSSHVDVQKFDTKLTDMAADGWELVTYTSVVQHSLMFSTSRTGYIIATFKRQKPNK
jgi:hypothetical protein